METSISIQISPEELKSMISDAVSSAIADVKQEDEKKYLTIEEVCNRFSLKSTQSVYNWVNKGILKAYKISDKTLFKTEEVDQAVIEKVVCKYKHQNGR